MKCWFTSTDVRLSKFKENIRLSFGEINEKYYQANQSVVDSGDIHMANNISLTWWNKFETLLDIVGIHHEGDSSPMNQPNPNDLMLDFSLKQWK